MVLTPTVCTLWLSCTSACGLPGRPTVSQAPVSSVVAPDNDAPPAAAPPTDPPQQEEAAQDQPPQQREPADRKEPPTPPHTGVRALTAGLVDDVKHLPSLPNLYLTALGGGLALGVHPIDQDVNVRLRGHQSAARAVFTPGKFAGYTPVQVGAALAVYAVGRARHQSKVSHFGMDLLRAQVVASALTTGVKYATQRERPDGSNSHSFPSGHAAITFATATVIERHLGWRMSAMGFSVASYVAASRLHDNRHYLSDVVFGAAVGAISGRTVTQHGRNVWALAPVPVPGGVALVALRTGAN
jgi:hypothetical protein